MSRIPLHNQPLSFSQEQEELIDKCLQSLATNTISPLVMVADVSGQLIRYRGRLSSKRSMGLAALAAGSFAAAAEVGRFLGMPQPFDSQLLEGQLANLYITSLQEELVLIVAFTERTTLGLVRLYIQQAQEELKVLIETAVAERTAAQADGKMRLHDDQFEGSLLKQLDELFTTGQNGA